MSIAYILITPARNEEDFIEQTIQSVVAQSITPKRWVIVNDGSTDHTGDIITSYADQYDFILPIHRSGDKDRNFGSKAKAVEFAYQQVSDLDFDYVGNLDADITFDPQYYENILTKMEANPQIGLAGGIRYDRVSDDDFIAVVPSSNSVGGPIQLFRRECWDQIGGYQVLPYGGIDAVAEISARMYNWEVRLLPEFHVYHHRRTGTANRSTFNAYYRAGIRDYTIGYHPFFEIFRAMSRIHNRPYILGSAFMLSGYMYAVLRRLERPVSPELIRYLQQEQLGRLKKTLTFNH